MKHNQNSVKIPGKHSFTNYRKSLTEYNSKHPHNFRGLYRNGKCKSKRWRADLTIWTCPTFPETPADNHEYYRMALNKSRKLCAEFNVSFKSAFRRNFSKISSAINQSTQLSDLRHSHPTHILNSLRGGWYHDPLLTDRDI